jgi:hypothetical protein
MSYCFPCSRGIVPFQANGCENCVMRLVDLTFKASLPFGKMTFTPHNTGLPYYPDKCQYLYPDEYCNKSCAGTYCNYHDLEIKEDRRKLPSANTCGYLTNNERCGILCSQRFCIGHYQAIKAKYAGRPAQKCKNDTCQKLTAYKYCQYHYNQKKAGIPPLNDETDAHYEGSDNDDYSNFFDYPPPEGGWKEVEQQ